MLENTELSRVRYAFVLAACRINGPAPNREAAIHRAYDPRWLCTFLSLLVLCSFSRATRAEASYTLSNR